MSRFTAQKTETYNLLAQINITHLNVLYHRMIFYHRKVKKKNEIEARVVCFFVVSIPFGTNIIEIYDVKKE